MIDTVHGNLVAVGAATPGVVLDGQILLAPNNPGWDTIALHEVLGELGTETVVVDNDVKAGALAEAREGALLGISHGIYLNLGTGIAAAAVIDGVVLRGAHGAAGEIGYQLVSRTPVGPAPDQHAPLEGYVAGAGIARRASILLGKSVSAQDALDPSNADEMLKRMLDDAFDALAVHLANLSIALDPERIAVGGGIARNHERFFPHLNDVLRSAVPFPPELVLARFTQDAALIGALILAANAAHI